MVKMVQNLALSGHTRPTRTAGTKCLHLKRRLDAHANPGLLGDPGLRPGCPRGLQRRHAYFRLHRQASLLL
jgi:hypothetical protein